MNAQNLRDALRIKPFVPFRIATSSGERYDIDDPQSVAVMKGRMFIALPTNRWVFVPYLHVSSMESRQNGHATKRRGRKP